MRTKGKRLLIVLCVVLILVIGLLCAEPILKIYRDVSFYWTEHTETEIRVKEYADAHGLSYGDYPESLIALLERNPETEAFVLEYPLYEKEHYDLSDFEGSKAVPLFLQWDQRWGYEKYGSDVIGITGCGPTCLAMVGYHLTGDDYYTPENMAAFAEMNGYYASGYGSSWTLISEGAVTLGFDVTEIPLVKKRITDNLEVGNPIILAMGKGDFTTTGHYIVLTGLQDGRFTVNDPNSVENSNKLWSYEQIESQIRNLWVIRYFG